MKIRIPVCRPTIEEEELRAVRSVLESRWLGMGAVVEEFEKQTAAVIGARHVIAVSNCTAALWMTLQALGVKAGDEVLVPSMTYVSTPQAVLAVGAKPVFCEVREHDLLMDPEDVARRMTPNTSAVIAVHYGGRICDISALRRALGGRTIWIIEDAAHAFGSRCRDGYAGTLADAGCLSFDPIKNITCGEGGVIVMGDDALAARLRRMRNVGMDAEGWRRLNTDRPWYYQVSEPGLRNIMTNISASIGLAQLRKLDRFRTRRLEIVRQYDKAFRGMPGIQTLEHEIEGVFPLSYVIRVLGGRRDRLMRQLAQKGIGSWVHFLPCHMQPLFAEAGVRLPVTERLYEEVVSLPLASDLTQEEAAEVIAAVREFANGGNG
ncbi:MAG: DegT/DnrJ/EryC1/StrS aminotransferase family protein [Bryobacteraceae bacterium]|nr:DegT/DnrJ/EryC1/StrS aminotransferase family protein [Bryobacteraceae bacterium]